MLVILLEVRDDRHFDGLLILIRYLPNSRANYSYHYECNISNILHVKILYFTIN